ncbi:MAG: chemotaxis signal transduction protein [Pedosphaera sp.]|nr:chemotaxis signal transduction protein [Pedosphaera sp.]
MGVIGDGTCPELAKFVHCRNCPIYSLAGVRLLDRELPANYRREWTEYFSREKKQTVAGKTSVITFRIDTEWLALSIAVFQEVLEQRNIHSLPHRQKGIVLGLVNVRGGLVICVSLGRLLGLEREQNNEKPLTDYNRLVVTEWNGNRLAFPANEVYGIHRYQQEELSEIPATIARTSSNFTKGILRWMDRSIGCLDEELLFSTLNRSLT